MFGLNFCYIYFSLPPTRFACTATPYHDHINNVVFNYNSSLLRGYEPTTTNVDCSSEASKVWLTVFPSQSSSSSPCVVLKDVAFQDLLFFLEAGIVLSVLRLGYSLGRAGIATRYGLDRPGIECRWGARFSAPV